MVGVTSSEGFLVILSNRRSYFMVIVLLFGGIVVKEDKESFDLSEYTAGVVLAAN